MIPGGYTRLIQPLDVSINGPFKNMVRHALDIGLYRLGQTAVDYSDIGTEYAGRDRRISMTSAVGNCKSIWQVVARF